ncbi:MAG TPA: cytochrome c oxidase subunit 3 [Frateuria sp.]|uniref:cytochrome c oxidase subunit 3 n=1 Tax=Frateuria sp. TaxID=2211372 RepID=UPI002D809C07|nr:cytochrome c oxidase subunit 3 [Frateuria sp.]HET6805112.1 cytochrome c oxidase subunit 3 [Frateuria sp.]
MSELVVQAGEEPQSLPVEYVRVAGLPWDQKRGTRAMFLFILTEAMLFVAMFFGYFYLGAGQPHWPMDDPPKLPKALWMLATLLASSGVLYTGEQLGKRGHAFAARVLVALTLCLGALFITIQVFEYRDHLRTLKPWDDAYASVFYTITSIHAVHVMTGMAFLLFTLFLPRPEHTDRPPYKALHNAGMYWHFVDLVWVFIVALLYVLPHLELAR